MQPNMMSPQARRKRPPVQSPTLDIAERQIVSQVPVTAGYKSVPHVWFQQPRDLPPFTFATIRAMLIDPEIRLNFSKRAAPLFGAEFGYQQGQQWTEGVECSHPEIGEFIYRQIKRIWSMFLPCILRSQIWGWSAGEVVMRLSEAGLVEIDKLEPRHASDCRLLKLDKKRWGVAFARVEEMGTVNLPFPYCWFHAYGAEDGDDYGVSVALGAYSPWADKWFNGGALDTRRLFMHKDAYGGTDLGYPEGDTWINNQAIPNIDIARRIVEQLQTGGVTTRPSTRDEHGNEKWPLTRATVPANPQHILQFPKDLDGEIRSGMEVPEEDDSGAWAGKRIEMASFYASLDQWIVQILRDLREQVIDPLLVLNFGVVPEYDIKAKPLAKQAMEQQSNAGPGGGQQPGMMGDDPLGMGGAQQPGQPQPGMDPQAPMLGMDQPQQPQMMSLAERVGAGITPLESLLANVKSIVRREVTPVTMSVDKTGHEHRGKGKGGGQFVAKGKGGEGADQQNGTKDTDAAPNGPKAPKVPNASLQNPSKSEQPPTKDVPGTDIEQEQITPPPPGKAFRVNVEATGPDGVALTARVGVPGKVVPPPPAIPKLPNLTKSERRAESDFMQAFMADPDGLADKYRQLIAQTNKPYTFETDQAKQLSKDWMDENLDVQMQKRQLYNNALHQTANAVVKRAFVRHLDTLKPGDNILVTVGGCGSGKGYTLKNTELGKNLTAEAKAVWDSAGDQNATENPWILEEAKKRGLTVTYAYVAGDPKVSWADPNRGVVKRAHDNSDGRMVDAAVFADSYVLGAKNHHAFHQANQNDPAAKFLFFSAKDQSTLPGVPPESLQWDRKALYHWAMGSIQGRQDVAPTVLRGATQGARIWNGEF